MKKIKLTKGYFTIVDDLDFEKVSKWKWSATKNGTKIYAVRNDMGRRIYLHRLIFGSTELVDHIDKNSLNNRRKNLRSANKQTNAINSDKMKTKTTSRFKGVHWAAQISRWRAKLSVNGKNISLGCFSSEEEAADAYKNATKKLYGSFAC